MSNCNVCKETPHEKYFGAAPPLLLSFPGSGNTWLRILIKHLIGYGTASIYNDPTLSHMVPCEGHCTHRVAAVKAHPNDILLTENKQLLAKHNPAVQKCFAGSTWSRVLFVGRDPFDSLFSDFHLFVTGSHSGTADFNKQGAKNFFPWKVRDESEKIGSFWRQVLSSQRPEVMGESKSLFLRYEDIMNPVTRHEQIKRIAGFVTNAPFVIANIDDSAIDLANNRSDTDNIHRKAKINKTEIYLNYENLICDIWSNTIEYVTYFNYTIMDGVKCDSGRYPNIVI